MSNRKYGSGLLAVAALSLMGAAATAQAGPQFLIGGAPIWALTATFGVKQLGTGTLLVPGYKFELKCSNVAVSVGLINSGTDATGQFLFEGCSVNVAPCQVIASAADLKPHVTATALLLPAELANGNYAILAENIYALILFASQMGCPLPLDQVVKGELCLSLDNNGTVEPSVLASKTIQGECRERPSLGSSAEGNGVKDKLLYSIGEGFIDGTANIFLSGFFPPLGHRGLTLGVSL